MGSGRLSERRKISFKMLVTTIFGLVLAAILLPESMQRQHQIPESCQIVCPYIMRKVCGSDGVTYDNNCLLRRARKCNNANVRFAKKGACKKKKEKKDCRSRKDTG